MAGSSGNETPGLVDSGRCVDPISIGTDPFGEFLGNRWSADHHFGFQIAVGTRVLNGGHCLFHFWHRCCQQSRDGDDVSIGFLGCRNETTSFDIGSKFDYPEAGALK